MGYTHFDKVSGVTGIGVGKKGSEVEVITKEGVVTAPVTGNVTGGLSGGEVNPTIAVVAGEAITAGNLVYISGYDATTGKVKVSKADADAAGKQAALFIAPANIADTAEGVVVGSFELTGQNTDAVTAVGDPIYLSTTAGGWTKDAPTGGGHSVQQVGVVTVKNATTGKILFFPFYSKVVTVNTTTA